VIDWTALPGAVSADEAEKLREDRQSQGAHRLSKPSVGIRFQAPGEEMPQKNWDYSITIG
jgi:hypothetical protein